MHIVNMKAVHPNFSAALGDPTGLAVLGTFIDVREHQFNVKHFLICFKNVLIRIHPAGCLRRQCPLWTHIPEAVLRRL